MTYIIKRKFRLTPEEATTYNKSMPFSMIEPIRVTSYLLPSPPGRAWTLEIYKGNIGTFFRTRPFYRTDDFRKNSERRIKIKQEFLRNFFLWLKDVTKAPRLVVLRKFLVIPKEKHITAILEEVPNEMGHFSGTYLTIIRNCRQSDNATLEKLIDTAKMFGLKDKQPLNISFTALRKAAIKGEELPLSGDNIEVAPGPKKDISKPVVMDNIDSDLDDLFNEVDKATSKGDEPPLETA